MKTKQVIGTLGIALAAALPGGARADATGEYVEARSLAVHAGACHYNGERLTAGREAVLAWKVKSGEIDGVRVDGLSVVALVAGGDNLADASTQRRSVLYVSDKASPAQQAALVKQIKAKAGSALGTVVAVKTVRQNLAFGDKKVTVTSGADVRLDVSRYACSHCMMPAETWYTPLTTITNAQVAQGLETGYKDATLGVSWSYEPGDNAFVGTFTL